MFLSQHPNCLLTEMSCPVILWNQWLLFDPLVCPSNIFGRHSETCGSTERSLHQLRLRSRLALEEPYRSLASFTRCSSGLCLMQIRRSSSVCSKASSRTTKD